MANTIIAKRLNLPSVKFTSLFNIFPATLSNFHTDGGKKDIRYLWGYRNHVICDAVSELPLTDLTKPANIHEQTLFIPLFDQLQQEFSLPIKAVLADAQYDAEYILRYVVKELEAKPHIARNPRWDSHSDVKLSRTGGLICIAGFEMKYWGKFTDRGKIRFNEVPCGKPQGILKVKNFSLPSKTSSFVTGYHHQH